MRNYPLHLFLSLLFLLFFCESCGMSRTSGNRNFNPGVDSSAKTNQVSIQQLSPSPKIGGKVVTIEYDYDLNGKDLVMEKDYTLKFRHGSLTNGRIIGNNTSIINTTDKPIFDRISFSGSWNVNYITTDFFKDLNYEQSLNDVLALANDEVKNRILIKDYGFDYVVVATTFDNYKGALHLPSNLDLQLDATIRLKPTNLFQYRIIMLYNRHDVKIHGKGSVIGDKDKHDFSIDEAHIAWKSHQWGHGIKLAGCNNIKIYGIEVSNCTGDSFSISDGTTNVELNSITAKNSRRQGVTIAVASDILISNCSFIGIGRENGTPPWSAIDIEPDDTDCEIRNITITGCNIINCPNGIISWSRCYGTEYEDTVDGVKVQKREGRRYVNIKVTDCRFEKISNAFALVGWDNVSIENCTVDNADYFMRAPLKNMTIRNNDGDCNHFTEGTIACNSIVKNNRIRLKEEKNYELNNSVLSNNDFSKNKKLRFISRFLGLFK